jgi:uncharacterized iron-regulated protein
MAAFWPLLLCCFVVLTGGCAGKNGRTADVPDDKASIRFVLPDGSLAGERDMLALVGEVDYILLGEVHDNPVDHKAQAAFIDLAVRKGGVRPLLGLEMLPRRYYDFSLAAFGKGQISLDDLPEALNWKNTWGYDFALYQPVFETARKYGLQIYGLNLPEAVRRSVSRKGLAGLSAVEKKELPARIIPPQAAQMEKLLAVFRMHGGMKRERPGVPAAASLSGAEEGRRRVLPVAERAAPEGTSTPYRHDLPEKGGAGIASAAVQGLDRFILIQSLWDSTMAEQAVTIRRTLRRRQQKQSSRIRPLPMIILAGAGHVEHGYGIASRIKALEPGARIALGVPFSGERPEPGAADIYYYSEARSHNPLGFIFAGSDGGMLIVRVVPGSRAEAAGMRAGDKIIWADEIPVRSSSDLHKAAMQAKRQKRPLRFILERGGATLQVHMPAPESRV